MYKSLIIIFMIFLFGCNDSTKNEKVTVNKNTTHQHEGDEAIELNNGKKWKVVDAMMIFIRNMDNAVAKFDENPSKDYSAISKTLNENLDSLLSNCSMEGKAHDELHKWLVPFIELSEKFEKEKENQNENFAEIKNSFITFNQYFE